MKSFVGLILDKNGSAKEIKYQVIDTINQKDKILWLHFDYTKTEAKEWITKKSGMDSIAIDALLAENTRPRTVILNDSLLVALRGINLEPKSKPEKMISLRIYISKNIIITTSKKNILSVLELEHELKKGVGIKSTSEFLVELTERMIDRIDDSIEKIQDRADTLEENLIINNNTEYRAEILNIRRETILLKRYLAPQKEALVRLYSEKLHWINEYQKIELRETTDKLIRYIEELDTIRDKVILIQEELMGVLSEQMNKKMFILSIISAIFLPLTFLTGLLGINVSGIPGASNQNAFFIFTAILVCVVAFQFILFKKKNWI